MNTSTECGGCARQFTTTEGYIAASGGLCPSCFAKRGVKLAVCETCGQGFTWSQEFYRTLGLKDAPKRCPRCIDLAHAARGKCDSPVQTREAVMVVPCAIVDLDMEAAEYLLKGADRPCPRLSVIDSHGKSYTGKLIVYDFRPDGARESGAPAQVRVMRSTHEAREIKRMCGEVMGKKHEEILRFEDPHEYLVLEPAPEGVQPVARLVLASWQHKWNASGGVESNEALFAKVLTSSSRSGRHGGGTVVALVDDEHPLLVRQDHVVRRYSLSGEEPDEAGFRAPEGSGSLSVFLSREDTDFQAAAKAAGLPARVVTGATVVRLLRSEDCRYPLPPNMPMDAEVRVEAAEAGGGLTNTGHAVVVCGPDGERLRPYATAGHRGPLACETHAWFSRRDALVTVHASRRGGVRIVAHRALRVGDAVELSKETLYDGGADGAPEAFSDAVKAAVTKAGCYHCRCVHYRA